MNYLATWEGCTVPPWNPSTSSVNYLATWEGCTSLRELFSHLGGVYNPSVNYFSHLGGVYNPSVNYLATWEGCTVPP